MTDEDIAAEMLAHCVSGRTLQMARIVSARFDEALRPYGITAHQMTLLSMIALRGSFTAREMIPFLKMDQSTLSRNLARLETRGLLKSQPDKEDARSQRISLTPSGRKTWRAANAGWRDAQDWARDAFGEEDMAELRRIAERLNPMLPNAE